MDARKPRLLQALNELYRSPEGLRHGVTDAASSFGTDSDVVAGFSAASGVAQGVGAPSNVTRGFSPAVPWLNGPEDSWL